MSVSAIVLAGGRSSRFGRDKLAEPIDGVPMLWRTIEAVRAVVDEVVVVTARDSTMTLPSAVQEVHDDGGGPLVGALAGLLEASGDTALVVGGDMPWLHHDVLIALIECVGPGVTAVALESDGRRQQLPIAVTRDPTLAVARRLVDAGERRFGALLEALDTVTLAEGQWRTLDPAADTLRDVDVPGDLPLP